MPSAPSPPNHRSIDPSIHDLLIKTRHNTNQTTEEVGEYESLVAMPPPRTEATSRPELRLADLITYLQGFLVPPKRAWHAFW